jgi:hypothetical protein
VKKQFYLAHVDFLLFWLRMVPAVKSRGRDHATANQSESKIEFSVMAGSLLVPEICSDRPFFIHPSRDARFRRGRKKTRSAPPYAAVRATQGGGIVVQPCMRAAPASTAFINVSLARWL